MKVINMLLIVLLLTACSVSPGSSQPDGVSGSPLLTPDMVPTWDGVIRTATPSPIIVIVTPQSHTPNPIWPTTEATAPPAWIFQGKVYVFTTNIAPEIWEVSGWRVEMTPISLGKTGLPPLDCTLYPRADVANQWAGGCTGYILVPMVGSDDLYIVITDLFGGTSIQQLIP